MYVCMYIVCTYEGRYVYRLKIGITEKRKDTLVVFSDHHKCKLASTLCPQAKPWMDTI